ncbi:MAG TPA: methionine adenosyltransferase [Clostridia bacterium]|nr:methionine adenosyltransferase [Clostridia bacterium]
MKRLFTSESVTEGHPDKICDRISDSILDAILAQDKNARVACECCCTTNFLLIMGEVTTTAKIDVEKIARDTIKDIGYDKDEYGFNYKNVEIKVTLNKQSPDIAMGVDASLEGRSTQELLDKTGAGDQGMMFGYATNETEQFMPLAIVLSHKICERLAEVRKNGTLSYLRPDGKAQVTVEYDDDEVARVDTIVVSAQHDPDVDIEKMRLDIIEKVVKPVVDENLIDEHTKFYINPTGRFVVGGPMGDSGLTGRKIIVDTYGGYAPHGGGCFSGKDPTKVDRSAAYYARYAAKNLVASGICSRCQICVAYAIGKANPVSIDVNTFGTGVVDDDRIIEIVKDVFDFRPQAIINNLKLTEPQYALSSSYGHFGRDTFNWERIDKAEEIRSCFTR